MPGLGAVSGYRAVVRGAGIARTRRPRDLSMFAPSSDCLACHNNLVTPSGEDVSIGASWRGTHDGELRTRSVRPGQRPSRDYRSRGASRRHRGRVCHLPHAGRAEDRAARRAGRRRSSRIWRISRAGARTDLDDVAVDGVSCTVCHQIAADRLGTRDSFNGNFVVAPPRADGRRRAFGPSAVDAGRRRLMHSVTGFEQEQAPHIRESELCATCHTLITEALGPDGKVIGSLPEQMNYQEWRHSSFFQERRSCQSCHMPWRRARCAIASVLGDYRETSVAAHIRGRQRVHAPPDESLPLRAWRRGDLGGAGGHGAGDDPAARTGHGDGDGRAGRRGDGTLAFDVVVTNLTGHKFPTGYPSRRAWLHVTVRDRQGRHGVRVRTGDRDRVDRRQRQRLGGGTFEPHHEEITRPDEVQIYESIMGTPAGRADHRPASGDAVPEGQPAAASRVRQADGGGRDRRVRRRRGGSRTSPATAIACATAFRDRSGLRRGRTAVSADRLSLGAESGAATTPPSRDDLSATTTILRRLRPSSWRGQHELLCHEDTSCGTPLCDIMCGRLARSPAPE